MKNYKKIGIIGIARSGIAAAFKLNSRECDVFLSDSNTQEKVKEIFEKTCYNTEEYRFSDFISDFEIEFNGHSERLLEMDLIIISPGVPLNIDILTRAKDCGITIWTEIEFAYRLTHPDTKIIAVTGSNGKSTTVSLINHILNFAGYDSVLAGNIGYAYSGFDIEKKHDFIVLELSSFQLDLIDTFCPDTAVILNITPDHLNRYKSFEDYAFSKINIFKNMYLGNAQEKTAIINYEDILLKTWMSKPTFKDFNDENFSVNQNFKIRTFSSNYEDMDCVDACLDFDKKISMRYNDDNLVISDKECNLLGIHNQMNIMACLLAVEKYVKDIKILLNALSSFSALEHRLEKVAEIVKKSSQKVTFINDSKATNTDSVKYALSSFTGDKNIHLLIGGSDKGEDFSVLKEYVSKYVKALYLIGDTAPNMKNVFKDFDTVYTFFSDKDNKENLQNFENAVRLAYLNAEDRDTVLLSPACASFDWFKNYEDRGNIFKKIVLKIKEEVE